MDEVACRIGTMPYGTFVLIILAESSHLCFTEDQNFLLRIRIFMDKNSCMRLPVGWETCPMECFGCSDNLG